MKTLGTRLSLPRGLAIALLALTVSAPTCSTANISDARMARDGEGSRATTTFSPKDKRFYAIVELANAPDDTVVRAVWTAVDVGKAAAPNSKIDEARTTHGDGRLTFNLSRQDPWPEGRYKVDVFLNDKDKPDRTLEFEVQ